MSGIIQDGFLEPPLFYWYVNDLPAACPNCLIEQFANNTKASKQIVTLHDSRVTSITLCPVQLGRAPRAAVFTRQMLVLVTKLP